MQGYTVSEQGKEKIRQYHNRMIAMQAGCWLGGIVIAIAGYSILSGILWWPVVLLIVWVTCFAAIFLLRFALIRVLHCDYVELLRDEGEPRLFLEVLHGLNRLHSGKRLYPVSMLNASAAYFYMGQYQESLTCLSEEYLEYAALTPQMQIWYWNNRFACHYGMGDWDAARAAFEELKQAVERYQEKTHFAHSIVWSERIYTECRRDIMDYEILTLDGRSVIPNMISDIQKELEATRRMLDRTNLLMQLGAKELARENYAAAQAAYDQVVQEGNHLYTAELARGKVRMIRERDPAVGLLQESETAAVRNLILAATGYSIPEEELRTSIIYVLHGDDAEPVGVARITNQMKFGELILDPQHDTGKNQFRLLEEMKRRGYETDEAESM